MEPRVSLITLGVGNLPRAKAFYTKLGFVASSQGGGEVVFLQAGAMALSLFPRESLACDAESVRGRRRFSRHHHCAQCA